MKLTSKSKLAELMFLQAMVKLDTQVAVPFAAQAAWDALACIGGSWKTVQVKCAYKRRGRSSFCVDAMKGGGYGNARTAASRKYSAGDFDYLAAVDIDIGNLWMVPASVAIGRRSIALRDEWRSW